MTQLPPPLPPVVPYAPPPAPRRLGWATAIAWLTIILCVALIMWAGTRRSTRQSTPAPTTGGEPNVELLIQSRLAIGLHHLARTDNKTGAASSPAAPLIVAMDEAASRSMTARVRLVPVVAELEGRDAAIKRLNELSADPQIRGALDDLEPLVGIYTAGADSLDATRREGLIARHGWFARLALSQGLSDDHPDRRAVLAAAKRTATVALAFGGLALLALAAGLVLLVVALVMFLNGRLRFAHVPPPPGRDGPFVESFAVYLVFMILASLALAAVFGNRNGDIPLAANFALVLAIPPAIAWLRMRKLTWAEVRYGLGLHRGRGWAREVFAGIAGYLAGLPLLFVALMVTSALSRATGATPTHPIVNEAADGVTPAVALQLYVLAAVFAPLLEEIMFRGALYHHVRRRVPWWLAGLLVGVIFAAIHPQGWVGIPMLATIAVMLAAVREWRGSIVGPVVAHACVNGVTVTMLVLMTG